MVVPLAALLLTALVVSAAAVAGQTASSSRAVVKVAFNKKLKRSIVVDGRGRTVYMFTADTGGTSNCITTVDPVCPKLWPAFTTDGAPQPGRGIKASLLGTTTRPDGKQQVTYNRHPLYYFRGGGSYAGDKKPGDVRGQKFFGVWFVLSPKGTPIRK